MSVEQIEVLLDELDDLLCAQDAITLEKQAVLDSIYTPEIKAMMREVEMEFAPRMEAVAKKAQEKDAEVRAAVLAHGASVKGKHRHAVWSKGKVSWDTKTLDGMALVIPQLNEARKEGAPSVAIKRI